MGLGPILLETNLSPVDLDPVLEEIKQITPAYLDPVLNEIKHIKPVGPDRS